jgi:hypothetical protein
MRYLIIILLLLASCAHQPFPEGEPTQPPMGYVIHCLENPDSPFCKEVDEWK